MGPNGMQAQLGLGYGWAMQDRQAEARARAAETKRRRNRDKLIRAADEVMRDEGMSATVEGIARAAGLSTATFYTFYPSRNALCVDAFTQLVIAVLEDTLTDSQSVLDRVMAIGKLCLQRRALLRAALIERLESPVKYPVSDAGIELHGLLARLPFLEPDSGNMLRVDVREVHDFVDRLACLLWQPVSLKSGGSWSTLTIETTLHMTALELLDGVASDRVIYPEGMVGTVDTVSNMVNQRLLSSEQFVDQLVRGIYSLKDS